MKHTNTRKQNKTLKIPPGVAEEGLNLLELFVELGGARKTRRRRRKILRRR